MMGAASLGIGFTPSAALHAFTMGAIGTMVLAMLTRVPLGHTGRALHASRLTVGAYAFLTLAVLSRILGDTLPGEYLTLIDLAAFAWCLALALFTWAYWPVLTRPPAATD